MKTHYIAGATCTLGMLIASCSTPPPAAPSTASKTASKENVMSAKVYEAFEVDEDKPPQKIGRITIEGGKLAIASLVDDSERESVQKSLDDLNNRPFLVEKAPPKGDERYAIDAKEYQRGEPGFDEILIRKLESSHAIHLEAAK